MTLSGWEIAECSECNCRFAHYVTSKMFVDEKTVGKCDNCYNEIDHDCVDEFQEDENHSFRIVGQKRFAKKPRDPSLGLSPNPEGLGLEPTEHGHNCLR